MTPEQMRQKSAEKVKKVQEMMSLLHIRVEAKQHVSQQGLIENVVFWIDDEKYPVAPEEGPKGAEPAQAEAEAPEASKTEGEVKQDA